jgi:hypothetical protein
LGGAAGPNASPLRGGADWGGLARLPARPKFVLGGSSGEERSGGAGVGGQPVEIFVGKRFCGVAGCVDDADGLGVVEDRDGEGILPAGVRACLGEPAGAGDGKGRLGCIEDE